MIRVLRMALVMLTHWFMMKLKKPKNSASYDAGFDWASSSLMSFESVSYIESQYGDFDEFDRGATQAIRNFNKIKDSWS